MELTTALCRQGSGFVSLHYILTKNRFTTKHLLFVIIDYKEKYFSQKR